MKKLENTLKFPIINFYLNFLNLFHKDIVLSMFIYKFQFHFHLQINLNAKINILISIYLIKILITFILKKLIDF